jgi:transposase
MSKTNEFQYFIGIDVSKKTLDISVLKQKEFLFHNQIDNIPKSITSFMKQLKSRGIDPKHCLFCAEHTGIYNEHIQGVCTEKKLALWVEKPLQIQRSQGMTRGKNDKVDSLRIAQYCFKNQDEAILWEAPRTVLVTIRRLVTLRQNLLKSMNGIKQVINEKTFLSSEDKKLLGSACRASVSTLKKDIRRIEKQILSIVKKDQELNRLYTIITSVDAIGMQTAIEIILTTNEFKNFTEAKKFACYAGVVPFDHSSGTSVNKRPRVSKMANMSVKTLLHMAALSAVRMKGELREYFIRKVAQGKNKMLVINAIRNKLILRIFAVVNKNKTYQKDLSISFA